ncbi:MAG: hypothetical protein ABSA11_14600 [Candidatus Bathyarchaeia archaeon]|jgi:hypothetical protein
MINGDQLLGNLYQILEESQGYKNVDAAVDFVANRGKRLSVIDRIQRIESRLGDQWNKQVLTPIEQTQLIVHSKYSTGKTIQNIEDFVLLDFDLLFDGPKALDKSDSLYDRYLYYEEFGARVKVLKEHILLGKLDDFIAISPEDLIHKVMGFKGELLSLIGIDPLSGETYRRFTETHESISPNLTGSGVVAEALDKSIKVVMKGLEEQRAIAQVRKGMENQGDSIEVPLSKHQNVDVVEGVPNGTYINKSLEKTSTLKKTRILKIYKHSNVDNTSIENNSNKDEKEKSEK